MISWIQKYFQKHFRLVFLLVLIAVALPMVVIYSSGGGGRGDSIKALERPFFNVNLDNPEQVRRMGTDAELSVFFRYGMPARGAQLERYALTRIAGLALADQLHLPNPTPDQIAKLVPTLRSFQNQQGQFDQSIYTRFADTLKNGGPGMPSIADVNRVLRDEARLAELTKLLSGPGYLLPADVKLELSRVDATWTAQVATLNYATFNPTIDVTDAAIAKFLADNPARYAVPVRPRVSMVEFKFENFIPPTAPTEAEMRAFYNANISSFPVPPETEKKDAAAPATPPDNFLKVREQVENDMKEAAGRRLAAEAANQLTVALYERKLKANSPQLAEFLAAQRKTPVPIAPFNPATPPADKAWLGEHAAQLSRLNEERYFSDPLPTPEGFAVLLWNETLPAYAPTLIEVRDRVAADYREAEKRRLFFERGAALKATLQAAATTPGGFAEKAGAEKLEVKSFANFKLSQPPPDFPVTAIEGLVQLNAGQVSDLIGTEAQGMFVYAQEKKLPDLTPANPRYAEIQRQFATMLASNSENAILTEMMEKELAKTARPATR